MSDVKSTHCRHGTTVSLGGDGRCRDCEIEALCTKVERLREAIIAYVVARGPCEDAEDGEGYCDDDDCLYCRLAQTVDESDKG